MGSASGASEPVEPGRIVGGKYRLVRRLAEGGMGEVWLARHEVLDADVAVKLMSAEILGTEHALARFEREAKASAKLKSGHIVRVHDFGVDGDTPFMVMELLDGEDFGTRLKRDGPMSVGELVPVARQIAKGLEVAHAAGFVHRDLKPSNIFIAREGGEEVVKVVDFGVARETKTKLVDEKTGSGVVLGSPHHMSPEQALGEKVDRRSDLWAFAVVIYRALAGRKPFDSDVLASLLLEIVSQPVPKITEIAPNLPADLDRFFARALHRKPARRFQSATALVDALEAIAEGKDVTPFLTVPSGVEVALGREDATAPSVDPDAVPRAEPRDERSASRALTAVTAGVPSLSTGTSSRRPLLWGALALCLVVVAFFVGRSGFEGSAAPTEESADTALPETSVEAPIETAEPEPTPSAAVSAAEPEPSASATATTVVAVPPIPRPVAPRPVPPPATVPAPPSPKPKPKVDPFTGIATP